MRLRLGVVGLLALCGCTGRLVRATTSEVVQATPERLARGEYLVNSVAACGSCHSGREGSPKDLGAFFGAGESTDHYLAGGMQMDVPPMAASIYMPNITSDATGLGMWTDDQIIRAMRDGINRDNKLMFPMMPFNAYQYMSDEDIRSVVAYLRSVPKVTNPNPRGETKAGGIMGLMLGIGMAHHDPVTSPVSPIERSDQVRYGEYLARLGDCASCHAGTNDGPPRKPEDPLWMAGGRVEDMPGVGKVPIRNLTSDEETGLGKYSAEQVKQALRTGTRLDGKKMAPPMSMFIPHWSTMKDEDLDALVAYLKSLKPAKNKIPERELTAEWKAKLGDG